MSRVQLFHGTIADIADTVRPAGRGSKASNHGSVGYRWGQRSDEHAFATENESDAWRWAQHSAWNYSAPEPRQRVYKVAAGSDAKIGVYHPDHPRWKGNAPTESGEAFPEWVSKRGFKVTEPIDIKPGHQGTFPQENWNQYVTRGRSTDANHPDWTTVQHGSPLSSSRKQWLDAEWDDEKERRVTWPPVGHMYPERPEIPGQESLFGRQWRA